LKGSPAFFTQIFLVPLYGCRNEMYWPSGEICAPVIRASPKNEFRSIIGGCCALQHVASTTTNAKKPATRFTRHSNRFNHTVETKPNCRDRPAGIRIGLCLGKFR